MDRFRLSNDSQTKLLVFLAAGCGVLAASDVVPPWLRITAGAVGAGSGAVVALLRPPGASPGIGGSRG